MGMFTAISSDAFENLQFNAGMLLRNFDPENPSTPSDEDIITATTGGISPSCVPNFIDLGEDVDNCPNGMMELMKLDYWEAKIGFTALTFTPETIKLGLGVADVEGEKITPRGDLSQDDFDDIWWVGDMTNGGWAAVHLKNALSVGGLTIKTTKKGKGQADMELKGHYSMAAQKDCPMEFFVAEPKA